MSKEHNLTIISMHWGYEVRIRDKEQYLFGYEMWATPAGVELLRAAEMHTVATYISRR